METLNNDDNPSVILDGSYRRNFANLNRVSIATSPAIARHLPPLIARCAQCAGRTAQEVPLPSGLRLHIAAAPIFGPEGDVFGVGLRAGPPSGHNLTPPTIGAAQWNNKTGSATVSPALRSLLGLSGNKSYCYTTPSTLFSRFDHWEDRPGFLSLFDATAPTDRWFGTATVRSRTGPRRYLYIAAKASATDHTVRALVCDISETDSPPPADYASAALRRLRPQFGHAVGIVDLKSRIIHEWIAAENSTLAQWGHHLPWVHVDDASIISEAVTRLLQGTYTATTLFRITIDDTNWITVKARWTLISGGDRPQALIEATPVSGVTDIVAFTNEHPRTQFDS
ncbi:DUF5593 domain-containing protein [Nocardia terpenica]|uniref:GAF domain-containing protein n=1 Tax=Nocardia terpenica TaxID=455432 RepID=UPI001892EAC2|nr:GAF domain-containing protein [Nocardia terpenica]MBF6061987.1 DUF5593 domain-containing protein [Nocardia terpenica]MBF6106213.1 DUF5593 domain-containing protein [Nocardia terpenica]MBF6110407.1 DUF5593 domain-containing protein [Nocardia terpenica]MBF6120756.1 DUF5593 domain-containing protein [Nocardia terpenica]MBF6151743.1 DUF5593 domain-containing protein [Nocardia terpenica]